MRIEKNRHLVMLSTLLRAEGYVTSAELARACMASVRTVKSDVALLNRELARERIGRIIPAKGRGYRLEVEDKDAFDRLREAGSADKPTFLLLHGFPTASHYFRNLMPLLEGSFHVVAPDFIGFGRSAAPDHTEFSYTFEHLTDYVDGFLDAMGIGSFYLYVFDYGAPIGFNLCLRHPGRVLGIVSQNGNVYQEGLGKKWEARAAYWANPTPELREQYKSAFAPKTIIGQYTGGEAEGTVGPDGYTLDIYYAQSPDYAERQSDLILDYRENVANYAKYQEYLRTYQPELIAAWGKNDPSFVWPGAEAFLRDDPKAEAHPIDGGHFALEAHWREIGQLILDRWA